MREEKQFRTDKSTNAFALLLAVTSGWGQLYIYIFLKSAVQIKFKTKQIKQMY